MVWREKAGYVATEINASEQRSAAGLRVKLEALMENRASFTEASPAPPAPAPRCAPRAARAGWRLAEGRGVSD